MTTFDRGAHPDLVEEEQAAESQAPAPPAPSPRAARGGGRRSQPEPAPDASAPTASSSDEQPAGDLRPAADEGESSSLATAEAPEWLSQARAAQDPNEMLKLLAANLSADELVKEERIAGVLGTLADRRARAILREQQQEAAERAKREAAQKGDLYALGELSAPEVLQRAQQQAAQTASTPFLEGVRAFQETLPPEVQADVAGRDWPGSPAEGVRAYLEAVVESRQKHEFDKELKRREPALRKAWLSETNGSGPTPEVDGGSAPGVREVTDEQVDAMSLTEYDAFFDENGRPRPGVRHRVTRGVPLTQR